MDEIEDGSQSETREMLPGGDHQYVFFDHSHSSVTAFYPQAARFGDLEYMKSRAVDALECARGRGTTTTANFVVQTLGRGSTSEISDEDYKEVKSDAESKHHHINDAAAAAALVESLSDEESCVDAVLKEKRVRRKLEVLGKMVGVDSGKPGDVLGEVVRVLRDLERTASQI